MKPKHGMRVLILNYYYYPHINAHGFKWVQLAEMLANAGCHVDVISGKVANFSKEEVRNHVSIKRVGLKREQIRESQAEGRRQGSIVKWIYKKIWWPDPCWHWTPYLIKELVKRRKSRYDYVISYYPVMAAHFGGLFYKWLNMGSIWWIADYGDPFSVCAEWPPNNQSIYGLLNRLTDKIVHSNCNALSVMNSETAGRYAAVLDESKTPKIVVTPHIAPEMQRQRVELKSRITFRYLGNFYPEVRTHESLFEFASTFEKYTGSSCEFELYGPTAYWRNITIPENIKIKGVVSREEALKLMASAQILIHPENNSSLFTPSKLVEFIASGRPVINLGNGTDKYQPLQRYTEIGYCLSVPQNEQGGSKERLAKFIEATRTGKGPSQEEIDWCLEGHHAADAITKMGLWKS